MGNKTYGIAIVIPKSKIHGADKNLTVGDQRSTASPKQAAAEALALTYTRYFSDWDKSVKAISYWKKHENLKAIGDVQHLGAERLMNLKEFRNKIFVTVYDIAAKKYFYYVSK